MKKQRSAKPLAEPPGADYTDEQLQTQAQIVANAFARAYNRKHGTRIPVPVFIDWNLHKTHPKTAGMAYSDMHIALNLILMRDYPREMLNCTVPHEMAHLAEMYEDKKFRRKTGDHGSAWVGMMESMTQPVLKYHGMNTKKAVMAYKAYKKAIKSK